MMSVVLHQRSHPKRSGQRQHQANLEVCEVEEEGKPMRPTIEKQS